MLSTTDYTIQQEALARLLFGDLANWVKIMKLNLNLVHAYLYYVYDAKHSDHQIYKFHQYQLKAVLPNFLCSPKVTCYTV